MFHFNYKTLLIILIACFALESQACRMSHNGNSDHLVVTIEGLMGRRLGSQAEKTANALNSTNYSVLSCAQDTDSEVSIASQIVNYKRKNPRARLTVMGHSLGGGDAVRLLGRAGVKVDDLVVWDGRNGCEGLLCRGKKYKRPSNVTRVTNFYQNGFMNGRRFEDDPCVRNRLRPGGHVSLPRRTRGEVNGILNGSRPQTSASCKSIEAKSSVGIPAIDAPLLKNPISIRRNAFMPKRVRRAGRIEIPNKWSSHRKANLPAKCDDRGRIYDCTWAEASALNYRNDSSR